MLTIQLDTVEMCDRTMFGCRISLLANLLLVVLFKWSNGEYSAFQQNPALVSPGGSHCCVMIATGCCPQFTGDKVTCIGPSGIPVQTGQPGGTVGGMPGIYPGIHGTGTPGIPSISPPGIPGIGSPGAYGTGIAGGIGLPGFQPTAPVSPGYGVYPTGVPQQPGTHFPTVSWPGPQIPPSEQTQRCNDILKEICRYCQQWNLLGTLQGGQQSLFYPQPAVMPSSYQQQIGVAGQQDSGTQPHMTNVDIKIPLWQSTGGVPAPPPNALPNVQENPWTVQVPLTWDGTVGQDLANAQALSLLQETNPAALGHPFVNYKNQLKTDDPGAADLQQMTQAQIDEAVRSMNEARLARQVARRWEIMTRMRAQAAARATAKYRYHSAGAAQTGRVELSRLNNSQSAYIPKITIRQQEVSSPLP
uniref:Uncharacterized protein n=1 Tax=Trichuris muris TaxID=70415 RepID=A0A5S6R0G3_TRIMR